MPQVLDGLEKSGLLPDEIFADTLYCSDENVQHAQEHGIELVGPTPSVSTALSNIKLKRFPPHFIMMETSSLLISRNWLRYGNQVAKEPVVRQNIDILLIYPAITVQVAFQILEPHSIGVDTAVADVLRA